MQSDYNHINDMVYDISGEVKLMFHTVISYTASNGKSYSNYNEYKTGNSSKSHTMIKRNLSYYLFFEDRRDKLEKICIYPENMFALLDRFEHIKRNWIDNDGIGIYAMMDSSLAILNPDEFIFMKLPMDKAIKIAPGILKTELGDIKCIDLYLNTNIPIQIVHEKFLGMYYVLKNLDMLNYANTTISFAMLMNTPVNRTDFSNTSSYNTPLTDTSSTSGTKGMSIRNSNKSAFFDD